MTISRDTGDRGHLASNPNLLINGNFRIWQRGTSGTSGYVADRWKTVDTNSVNRYVRTNVPGHSEAVVLSFGHSSNEECVAGQRIESHNISYLAEAGAPVTVSFWIRSTAGTASAKLRLVSPLNVDDWTGVQAISAQNPLWAQDNAPTDWTFYSFTVPNLSPTDKTGLSVEILRGGESPSTTEIAFVKLEEGSYATPFAPRSIGEELALCQRYFQLYTMTIPMIIVFTPNGDTRGGVHSLPTTMRTTPTVTPGSSEFYGLWVGYAGNVVNEGWDCTFLGADPQHVQISMDGAASATIQAVGAVAAGGASAAYTLACNAEL